MASEPDPMYPITREELVMFRELICGPAVVDWTQRGPGGKFESGPNESDAEKRRELGELLGLDRVTIWRLETGSTRIAHGILLRRALLQLCGERHLKVTRRLRYGRPQGVTDDTDQRH